MGYALKIKGVDFSDNAVDQVDYIVPIPCTGITLNQSALTFEKVGDTNQLTATLTPADTTDTLSWASSDENVATVSASGLVTIHGIGTATITATCGNQTATASINQTSIKPKTQFTVTGKIPSPLNLTEGKIMQIFSTSGQNTIGQAYSEGDTGLHIESGQGDGVECIAVPYGATKVKFTTVDGNTQTISYTYKVDATTLLEFNSKQYGAFVSEHTFVSSANGLSVEYGQAVIFRATDAQFANVADVFFT